jgi:hypothetical protein
VAYDGQEQCQRLDEQESICCQSTLRRDSDRLEDTSSRTTLRASMKDTKDLTATTTKSTAADDLTRLLKHAAKRQLMNLTR